nr:hypothetical protein WGDTHNWE_WGDTHNWE_CDS_0006 [Microvirus sp.]
MITGQEITFFVWGYRIPIQKFKKETSHQSKNRGKSISNRLTSYNQFIRHISKQY